MRRGASTIVCLVGEVTEDVLALLAAAGNVVLVRGTEDGFDAAIGALDEAGRRAAPYVVVAADPLAGAAEAWRAMWHAGAPSDPASFELEAGRASEAWQAGRFELPDYYLVLVEPPQAAGVPETAAPAPHPHDLHLGALRLLAPARVVAVVTADARETAARALHALATLPQSPWWPPLDELIAHARTFFPERIAG
jgi:hypothetical protein